MAQEFYKKIYSVGEFYSILYDGVRTMKYMIKAKKKNELSPEFIERIMLGVTEVNGCEVCSYAHTKMALEQGMTAEEIQKLLAGSADKIPVEEMPAYLFAQHFADRRGYPTEESWDRIVSLYGEDKAKGILGAVRAIMVGNAHGIAISAFMSRLKGKAVKKSSLVYELTMMLSIIVYLPLVLIQAMMDGLFKRPIITF
ncbi:alkylhydroperoxidase ahpd core [Trichococcus collinsii]|uniref:Alkylhydroperoxidase AhpD family core domain-containing protein n=2 Tax=Trichococcus collinsii TaxID=157076 RepID=A0AB38A0T6_9LACT|nr:alkylhydroperoxidase ahpd core [Trichococcus collinsii]SEA46662.1 alkylhydroperoxidase AhpD family core domain-containing protein [Trichococcus collinsii]